MQRAQRGIRALALRSAEKEDRRQLMWPTQCKYRQGLQWEWYHSCKGMLGGWGAERRRLKLQALDKHKIYGITDV